MAPVPTNFTPSGRTVMKTLALHLVLALVVLFLLALVAVLAVLAFNGNFLAVASLFLIAYGNRVLSSALSLIQD